MYTLSRGQRVLIHDVESPYDGQIGVISRDLGGFVYVIVDPWEKRILGTFHRVELELAEIPVTELFTLKIPQADPAAFLKGLMGSR